ncbi:DUF4129 domain-containing protein [Flavobacteriaceae bacterium TP-CH-4]|uniref:DUF4129 domain-containing protein n=1 Tax=Pelagihabitans pacificus TaxID=2696054 RepID=A0A967AVS4_9FLAO|nr:DUF4129 domain-containing protein [Pelagihabitans pacificus]NHF61311.1 DUF4129 domain-containing protein [Pelagihabitans pacificus]
MQQLLFVLLFGLSLSASLGQDTIPITYDWEPLEVVEISEDRLEAYRNDPAFDYEVVKTERTWWDDFKEWLGNVLLRFFEWVFGAEKAVGFLANFIRIIPYILLGVLIFILIKFFLKANANAMELAKKDESLVVLSEEEHLIKNEDIQVLIQKALTAKDYRLAIRYYYLFILQKMSAKNLIEWQLQKTNDDYLEELQSKELKGPFRTITRLYDYIWYGSFSLDEAKYQRAERAFQKLQQTLDRNA